MQRLGLYDFYSMFEHARSFALVGNAGTILAYDNGAEIDSHDVVIRFNCAFTDGIEAKIGARTDVICANIGRNLDTCPSPATTCRPRCIVNFADRSPRDGNCEPDRFVEWCADTPTLITWAPDLIGIPQGRRTRQLTQGTYMLFTILRLFRVERLFVTGFTMYQPVPGRPPKYLGESRADVGTSHDLDSEASIFTAILQSYEGTLKATPEVEALLGQSKTSAALRRGFLSGSKGTGEIKWHEQLRGWLALWLMRGALGLRRGLETNSTFDFDAFHNRQPTESPPPPVPHVRRRKKRKAAAEQR